MPDQLTLLPGPFATGSGQLVVVPDQLAVGPGQLLAAGCLVVAALVAAMLLRPGQRPAHRLTTLRAHATRSADQVGATTKPGGTSVGLTATGGTGVGPAISGGTSVGPAVTGRSSPMATGRSGPAATDRSGPDGSRSRLPGVDLLRLTAGLAGVAVTVVVGGWAGLTAGVLSGVALDRLLRRIEPPAVRVRRLAEVADLPLTADLLAAAMRAGAPVDRAVTAVAEALGGPLADRLGRVGRTLLLGGGPAEAWAHLAPVAGADRLVTAAVRSAESGAALAGALARLADDLRTDRATAAEASARRAGVLIVLPLGLCFLPAFILAGLVPVIVAVLGDVL